MSLAVVIDNNGTYCEKNIHPCCLC